MHESYPQPGREAKEKSGENKPSNRVDFGRFLSNPG